MDFELDNLKCEYYYCPKKKNVNIIEDSSNGTIESEVGLSGNPPTMPERLEKDTPSSELDNGSQPLTPFCLNPLQPSPP